MEKEYTEADLELLPYREVQKMAKAMKLPSNFKKKYLIKMLIAREKKLEDEVQSIAQLALKERQHLQDEPESGGKLPYTEADLELLPYREVQKMAKAMQLPSNFKKVYLIQMVIAREKKLEDEVLRIAQLVWQERLQLQRSKLVGEVHPPEPPVAPTDRVLRSGNGRLMRSKPNNILMNDPELPEVENLQPQPKRQRTISGIQQIRPSPKFSPMHYETKCVRIKGSNGEYTTINAVVERSQKHQKSYPGSTPMNTGSFTPHVDGVQTNTGNLKPHVHVTPRTHSSKFDNLQPEPKRQRTISGIQQIRPSPKFSPMHYETTCVRIKGSNGEYMTINAVVERSQKHQKSYPGSTPMNTGSFTPHVDGVQTNMGNLTPHMDGVSTNTRSLTPHVDVSMNTGSLTPHIDVSMNTGSLTPHIDVSMNTGSLTPHVDVSMNTRSLTPHIDVSMNTGSITPHINEVQVNTGSLTPHVDEVQLNMGNLVNSSDPKNVNSFNSSDLSKDSTVTVDSNKQIKCCQPSLDMDTSKDGDIITDDNISADQVRSNRINQTNETESETRTRQTLPAINTVFPQLNTSSQHLANPVFFKSVTMYPVTEAFVERYFQRSLQRRAANTAGVSGLSSTIHGGSAYNVHSAGAAPVPEHAQSQVYQNLKYKFFAVPYDSSHEDAQIHSTTSEEKVAEVDCTDDIQLDEARYDLVPTLSQSSQYYSPEYGSECSADSRSVQPGTPRYEVMDFALNPRPATNVTLADEIPDFVEESDAADTRMQCILCSWAGPKMVLSIHIEKFHSDLIIDEHKNVWNYTWRLGSLINQCHWLSMVINYENVLYALSVKYEDPEHFLANISVINRSKELHTGSLTIHNEATGEQFEWSGEIKEIDENMPIRTDSVCLTTQLSQLNALPIRENPSKVVVGLPYLSDLITVFVTVD